MRENSYTHKLLQFYPFAHGEWKIRWANAAMTMLFFSFSFSNRHHSRLHHHHEHCYHSSCTVPQNGNGAKHSFRFQFEFQFRCEMIQLSPLFSTLLSFTIQLFGAGFLFSFVLLLLKSENKTWFKRHIKNKQKKTEKHSKIKGKQKTEKRKKKLFDDQIRIKVNNI